MEGDDDLGAGAMDFAAPDLHNLADRDWFIAADIEYSFEDEVGVMPAARKAVA